jgi:hypothetical protein
MSFAKSRVGVFLAATVVATIAVATLSRPRAAPPYPTR